MSITDKADMNKRSTGLKMSSSTIHKIKIINVYNRGIYFELWMNTFPWRKVTGMRNVIFMFNNTRNGNTNTERCVSVF